jgi:molybdopterin synthase catalytic subunit
MTTEGSSSRVCRPSRSTRALVDRIRRSNCGGLVVFEGSTRSPSEGKTVLRLEYEAYEERARRQLDELAREATRRWDLGGVIAVHRTGVVPIGEPSIVVATVSPHRSEAFEAARWLIDTIKEQVAIWKKEIFADGSRWVGAETVEGPHEQANMP